MTVQRLALFLAVLFGLYADAFVSAQDAPIDEMLFMTFVPNVQFAPVYVALEKGYFTEAGFNLAIEHGDEPVGLELIATGERNFGIISGEQLLTARGRGRPVVFVYEWFQRYPVGVVADANSGIESVGDLRGRRVGIPGRFGASYSGLTALLAANGMTDQDVSLQEIGFNAPEVFCVGGVEASVVYVNNEPLQIRNRSQQSDCGDVADVRLLMVADYADLVSNGVVTNEVMVAEQPERLAAFVRAYDAGLRAVISNPAEAYLISLDYVENLPGGDALRMALETLADDQVDWLTENDGASREEVGARRAAALETLQEQFSGDDLIQFEVLLSSIDLWDADTLGYTDPASWETTQATLLQMGFMEAPLDDLTSAYSNAFLPGAEEG